MRSVWSRVGTGSTTVVSPVGEEPGEEQARLHLGARDRKLVLDPVERARVDPERQVPVRRLDARSHRCERLGDPAHRPRGERLVAAELELLPRLPGEDACDQADERARVAAVDRLLRRLAGRAGRRRGRAACPGPPRRPRRRARARRARSTACPPTGRSPGRPSPPRRSPRSARARCEIDLSPGTATAPRRLTAGATKVTGSPCRAARAAPRPTPRSARSERPSAGSKSRRRTSGSRGVPSRSRSGRPSATACAASRHSRRSSASTTLAASL